MRSYTVEAGGGGGDTVHCTLAVVTPDTGPAPETDSNKPPQPTTHPIPGHSATHSTARHNFVAKKHHQQKSYKYKNDNDTYNNITFQSFHISLFPNSDI